MVTTAMAWSINWAETRKRHELAAVEPLEGVGYPPATRKPLPVTPAVRPAVAAVATGGRHFRQAATGTASSQPA
jgi:hypothetical protein